MSSNATSNSSEGKKLNRRFERENPTILTSTIREEDVESDENYELLKIILILLLFILFHFWWLITAISIEYRYGDFWAFF